MRFELVKQLKQTAVPVYQLCRVLAPSRSGYYPARKRNQAKPAFAPSQRAPEGKFIKPLGSCFKRCRHA